MQNITIYAKYCVIFLQYPNYVLPLQKNQYSLMAKSINRERFERVASNRVQRTIDTLALLSNCSNRSNYEYTKEDVDLMFSTITKALRDSKAVFYNELEKGEKRGFTFKK